MLELWQSTEVEHGGVRRIGGSPEATATNLSHGLDLRVDEKRGKGREQEVLM
jgi:hypothetical protein